MEKIKIKLISLSSHGHLQQIYTGFFLLHRMGLIKLEQVIEKQDLYDDTKPHHLRDARKGHLRVILNDKINLHYDVHDSWEIDDEKLASTDYYFKRSYSAEQIQKLGPDRKKIFPLGLNYMVCPDNMDWFDIKRNLVLSNGKLKLFALRYTKIFNKFQYTPTIINQWSLPDYTIPSKILFMVRAFDPDYDSDLSKEKIEERMQINEDRYKCIKLLKNEFGEKFYGGFSHTDYAIKKYKDALVPDATQTSKRKYVELLQAYPICIATTGLHGSIGWKFSEYVAFSKAIISEKLNYEVPGQFSEGKNYLEFRSSDDCVAKAQILFSDKNLRQTIMKNNAKYYHAYLRPDSLVLNTIMLALTKKDKI